MNERDERDPVPSFEAKLHQTTYIGYDAGRESWAKMRVCFEWWEMHRSPYLPPEGQPTAAKRRPSLLAPCAVAVSLAAC